MYASLNQRNSSGKTPLKIKEPRGPWKTRIHKKDKNYSTRANEILLIFGILS